MEYSDAAHKRAVEIEAALREVARTRGTAAISASIDRGEKALLPVYEPLVKAMGQYGVSPHGQRNIGASYLEAAADRLEAKDRAHRAYSVRDLRDWAKSERAIEP